MRIYVAAAREDIEIARGFMRVNLPQYAPMTTLKSTAPALTGDSASCMLGV